MFHSVNERNAFRRMLTEGARRALARCEAIFRAQETNKRMRPAARCAALAYQSCSATGEAHRRALEAGAQHHRPAAGALNHAGGCRLGRRWKLCVSVHSAFSQRAAASALSSGRVLNAIAASGAALCTALITASNIDRLWGGRRMPAPITTQS
jgi:hypothetical protein